MENWFKLDASYDSDIAIATVDDAAEVMFVRGLGYCRRSRSGGFIPTAVLHSLTRTPGRAKRIAAQLCRPAADGSPGPWETAPGGYRVRNYEVHNEAADALEERRRSDRERKRRQRSKTSPPDPDPSTGPSRDSHGNVQRERREREEAAAAAASHAPTTPLPVALDILRGQLDARKLVVRWDTLTADERAEVEHLIDRHGDAALVASAVRSFQPNRPPASARAWLSQWRDLRAPGDLALVADDCTLPGHTGSTRHCAQCASEKKAAR